MTEFKNTVTLDEVVDDIRARESLIKEDVPATLMIDGATSAVIEAAKDERPVVIKTDYDADGICSAYIMEKTLKAINPDIDVTVECNDRRGSYGLSPDVQGEEDKRYIVLDMGSNQLGLARERLGEDVIILDHHLIESETAKEKFKDNKGDNICLCNPHAINDNDIHNAQYCATGLAYRVFQTAEEKGIIKPEEKLKNTLAVMACIGTATDMVDVMDMNGYNRDILKNGLKTIDNADETNLDFVIGNVLARNKIGEEATAYQVAFNVGSFLNSASRMSEVINDNGAMMMYDAITGDENDYQTYRKLDRLCEMNAERKNMINSLVAEDAYKEFVEAHRYGDKASDNIGVYQLPDNVPAAFAGLVAGKLAEATDKAIICLTYSESRGTYTGSGRNAASNETSILRFMQDALAKESELYGNESLSIQYGGHEDAIGISRLNDITRFTQLIEESKDNMLSKPLSDMPILKISISEINSPKTTELLRMCEPTGIGNSNMTAVVEGKESYRDKLFLAGNPNWKKVRIGETGSKETLDISDWNYNSASYPQAEKFDKKGMPTGKTDGITSALVELSLSDYKGMHTEATAKFSRQFLDERVKDIILSKPEQKETKAVKEQVEKD